MKNISEVTNCYGCMACMDRCPASCISPARTALGHVVPEVDPDKCVECGACLRVCPDLHHEPLMAEPASAIAAWHKDAASRCASSSGAVAAAIAEAMVAKGGVVYGCAFKPGFEVSHVRCTTPEELKHLRGSKYVQSLTAGVFRQVAADLKAGLEVLFIGTPCQVAAVRNYTGSSPLLFTADLICHGVPSLELLKASVPDTVSVEDSTAVSFRHDNRFEFSMELLGGLTYTRALHSDLYLKAFFTGLDYRQSCYHCAFAKPKRCGDLTLGDFWGLKMPVAEGEAEKGISLCLVNSAKGAAMLDSIRHVSYQYERPVDEAVSGNHQLRHPKKKTLRAKLFQRLYPMVGFNKAVILSIPDIYLKNKLMH